MILRVLKFNINLVKQLSTVPYKGLWTTVQSHQFIRSISKIFKISIPLAINLWTTNSWWRRYICLKRERELSRKEPETIMMKICWICDRSYKRKLEETKNEKELYRLVLKALQKTHNQIQIPSPDGFWISPRSFIFLVPKKNLLS